MMAAIKVDSPLMSRNIVEIFDIIDSISLELEGQRNAIGLLSEVLHERDLKSSEAVRDLLVGLQESTDYCYRMLM